MGPVFKALDFRLHPLPSAAVLAALPRGHAALQEHDDDDDLVQKSEMGLVYIGQLYRSPLYGLGLSRQKGILTRLRAGRSGVRIAVGGEFFCTRPASYTKGTGSFPGVKRPGRGVDHPPYLAPELKEE
jgi:hypothetical protein